MRETSPSVVAEEIFYTLGEVDTITETETILLLLEYKISPLPQQKERFTSWHKMKQRLLCFILCHEVNLSFCCDRGDILYSRRSSIVSVSVIVS
jgi:hypothetical protein